MYFSNTGPLLSATFLVFISFVKARSTFQPNLDHDRVSGQVILEEQKPYFPGKQVRLDNF